MPVFFDDNFGKLQPGIPHKKRLPSPILLSSMSQAPIDMREPPAHSTGEVGNDANATQKRREDRVVEKLRKPMPAGAYSEGLQSMLATAGDTLGKRKRKPDCGSEEGSGEATRKAASAVGLIKMFRDERVMLPKWEGSTEEEEAQYEEAWNSDYKARFHEMKKRAKYLHRIAELGTALESVLLPQISQLKEDAHLLDDQRYVEEAGKWIQSGVQSLVVQHVKSAPSADPQLWTDVLEELRQLDRDFLLGCDRKQIRVIKTRHNLFDVMVDLTRMVNAHARQKQDPPQAGHHEWEVTLDAELAKTRAFIAQDLSLNDDAHEAARRHCTDVRRKIRERAEQ